MRALARSVYYASKRDINLLSSWLEDAAGAPCPLVYLDSSGEGVLWAEAGSGTLDVPRIECHLSAGGDARIFLIDDDGEFVCRVGDFGVLLPAVERRPGRFVSGAEVVPTIDHLRRLPGLAHHVYGIAWAYTQMDDFENVRVHSLAENLNLKVNPGITPELQFLFGEAQLWRSSDGDLLLQTQYEQVSYFMLISKYHFRNQDGTPFRLRGMNQHSDGTISSVRILSSVDPIEILDNYNLSQGPMPGHWDLVASGWSAL